MLREKPEFYKEEVRCGYTVNEKTKRVWAVQLEMLDEVERICKANGLKYFAAELSLALSAMKDIFHGMMILTWSCCGKIMINLCRLPRNG